MTSYFALRGGLFIIPWRMIPAQYRANQFLNNDKRRWGTRRRRNRHVMEEEKKRVDNENIHVTLFN